MWRSGPQIDAAATWTRTSPGPGVGAGTSTSSSPGPGADFRSARMVVGTGSVTAEGYFPPRRSARTPARSSASRDSAPRRVHPRRDPAAVGLVDGRARRDDLVDRVEGRVV